VALHVLPAVHHAAATRRCGVGHAGIDRYLLKTGPTAANLFHAAAAGKWDRQTRGWADTLMFHRPCSTYYVSSAITIPDDKAYSNS